MGTKRDLSRPATVGVAFAGVADNSLHGRLTQSDICALRRVPLAVAIALTLPLAALAADSLPGARHDIVTPSTALALMSAAPSHITGKVRRPARASPRAIATARVVGNCNDNGDGSLRAAANVAVDGDVIDMTGLTCAAISLTTGEISLSADNVTLAGPTNRTLFINAYHDTRLIRHTGQGVISIYDVTLENGVYGNLGGPPPPQISKGGCVYSAGSIVLERVSTDDCRVYSSFSGVTTGAGGAFAARDYALIEDSHLGFSLITGWANADNATARGGGIYARDVYLFRSTIEGAQTRSGSGTASGGAIFAKGNAIIDRSRVSYCYAGETDNNFATSSYGGAVYVAGGASAALGTTISNSTFSHNNARNVAAIEIVKAPAAPYTALIFNSTISGNTAANRAGGIVSSMPLDIRNSTIAFNNAGTDSVAAGLEVYNTTVDLQSTIIARNYSPGARTDFNIQSSTVTGSHNLIMLSPVAPSLTLTADPQLNALAFIGGPTPTLTLKITSPAIGQGNNVMSLPYDQRGPGFSRIVDGSVDIGAVEFNSDVVFVDGFEFIYHP